jgi:hypothetical protein
VANILTIDEDIDETPDLAGIVKDLLLQTAVAILDIIEDFTDRTSLYIHLALTLSEFSQGSGNPNRYRHSLPPGDISTNGKHGILPDGQPQRGHNHAVVTI